MKILPTFAILFFASHIFAQTMNENLGSVPCDFILLSFGDTLQTTKQQLIQRSEKKTEYSRNHYGSYHSGIAHTEWHLEFVSKNQIRTRLIQYSEKSKHRRKYAVIFRDANNLTLLKIYLRRNAIRKWLGGTLAEPTNIYSLDLLNIPLLIIEDVKFIDIAYIE